MIADMASRKNIRHSPARRFFGGLITVVVVLAVLVVVFIVVANVYTIATTRDDLHTVADLEGADADAIVVLGASVRADGTPSDILANRLEVAVDLYKAGAAHTIIVSGDGRDSHYDEPDAMRAYCVRLDVPEEDVFVDYQGYNTYASIYRAKNVFGAEDVIVVTQAYHLYRALFLAQGLGMQACGVAADKGSYDNQTLYSVREVGARAKAVIQVLFHVQPDEKLDSDT